MKNSVASRTGVAIALLLGFSCVSTTVRAAAETTTFDWPVPARIVVNLEREKRGQTIDARFYAVTQAGLDGTVLVTFEDFEILRFNGREINTPEERASVAAVQALSSFNPGFQISEEGELLSLVDYDPEAAVAGLREYLGEHFHRLIQSDPQAAAKIDQIFDQMRSPVWQAQIEAKLADSWYVWVQGWRDVALNETEPQVFITLVPLFGHELEQETVIRNLGPDQACRHCVRLRAESKLEGPEFWDALRNALGRTAPALQGALSGIGTIRGRRELLTEAVIDPKTLRPVSVLYETKLVMQVPGDPPRQQIERDFWSFTWPADPH